MLGVAKYWTAFVWDANVGGKAYEYMLQSLKERMVRLNARHYHPLQWTPSHYQLAAQHGSGITGDGGGKYRLQQNGAEGASGAAQPMIGLPHAEQPRQVWNGDTSLDVPAEVVIIQDTEADAIEEQKHGYQPDGRPTTQVEHQR